MIAVTFLSSSRLWLLVVVGAMAVAYGTLSLRRKTYALRFSNLELLRSVAPKQPGWRRHVPAVLLLVALSSMVLALARPAREEKVPRERATVILAIDTSLSMEATDVKPDRIKAAQRAAKVFLEIIPPKINVGLVTFDGAASVLVPPTTDRLAVSNAIDRVTLRERTAIGEAIFTSLDAIKLAPQAENEDEAVPARIVLMSDGETTVGRPDAVAAREAVRQNVPVSTIAFGTDNGTITMPNPNKSGDFITQEVNVNTEALAAIARSTGGTAFTAASESQLRKVYEDIGSSVGFALEFREIGLWFVGFALLMLFFSSGFSLLWFSRLP